MKDPDRHSLHLLSGIVLISGIGLGIISPIIPVYADDLGASSYLLGVMVASFAVFQVIFQTPGGLFSDKLGPKRIIAIGLILNAVSSFLFTVTENLYLFIVFRAIDGAGSGLIFPAVAAYVFSISTGENRGGYMGTFLSAWILGFTIGPAVGGVLADSYDINTPFYFSTGINLLALVLMQIILKDPEGSREITRGKPFMERCREIVRKSGMPAVLFRGFTIQFNNGIHMMALAVFLYDVVGMTKTLIGLIFFTEGIVMLGFTPFGGRLTDRIGRKKPIIFGGIAVAFGFFMLPTVENFHYTIGMVIVDEFAYACTLIAFIGFGFGINSPAAMSLITETSPGKQKGTGMGVYGTISGTGFIIGPVVAGILYAMDTSYPFRLAALMALISITFVHFFVKETGGMNRLQARKQMNVRI